MSRHKQESWTLLCEFTVAEGQPFKPNDRETARMHATGADSRMADGAAKAWRTEETHLPDGSTVYRTFELK